MRFSPRTNKAEPLPQTERPWWRLALGFCILLALMGANINRMRMIQMDEWPAMWTVDAIPAAISDLKYGNRDGYTSFDAVDSAFYGVMKRENYVSPGIDRATAAALDLNPRTMRRETHVLGGDDKGIVDFVKLSFRLFGYRSNRIIYLYFILLFLSIAVFAFSFPDTLFPQVASGAFLVGHYLIMPAVFYNDQLKSVLALRFLPVLGLMATLHCLFFVMRPQCRWWRIAALAGQAALLIFVVHLRSTTTWELTLVVCCCGVAGVRLFRLRRYREIAGVCLPAMLLAAGMIFLTGYRRVAFDGRYRAGHQIVTRPFWHNILSGLAFDPFLARRYDLKIDDGTEVKAVYAYLVDRGRKGEWAAMASPFNWSVYDSMARELLWSMACRYPVDVFAGIFYYHPLALGENLAWLCGFRSDVPHVDLFVSPNIGNFMESELTELTKALDRGHFRFILWNQLALIAVAGFAALLCFQRFPKGRTADWIPIGILALGSLVPDIIGYPAPHTLGEPALILAATLYVGLACGLALILRSIFRRVPRRRFDIHWHRVGWVGALVLGAALPAWFWITEGWYHYELLSVPEAVWSPARSGSWLRQMGTVLADWRIFDPNPHRLRPLSDLVEVVDAILRPMQFFGTQPSLTLCAVLLAVATMVLVYRTARASGQAAFEAAVYTLLLATTIGFLSCFVPYIRPAKKLALFFCSLMLLSCCRFRNRRQGLVPLLASLVLAFFADEAGFVFWPVAGLLVGPIFVRERRWKGAAALAALPLVYLATVRWAVPALYALIGVPRLMQVGVMKSLLVNLTFGKFYLVAARDFAAGALATFGMMGAPNWIGDIALLVFAVVVIWTLLLRQWWRAAAVVAPVIASFGLTLFDWYNTPFGSNAFGALTYYYHSPVALLIVFALLQWPWPKGILVPGVLVIVAANLAAFSTINRLAMIMHAYPVEARALPEKLERPTELATEFASRIHRLNRREGEWLQHTFDNYRNHPMGGGVYADRFNDIFFPRVFKGGHPALASVDLEVRFPLNRFGLSEPLITTGATGAGDLIYIVYVDAGHVQVGFDHWGIRGFVSPLVAVDYHSVHVLRIAFGALLPLSRDTWPSSLSRAEIKAISGRVRITIDGNAALDVASESYEVPSASILIGRNQIGGSTTGPRFTGTIVRTGPYSLRR